MANGLYEPDECESERTVIISELQGGENDPDQLLDTEVTATAFRAHRYRHPTIGWLRRSPVDDARRSLRPLSPLLHPEQRHARRRRRRRRRRRAAAGRADVRRHSAGAEPPRRVRSSSRRRSASGASSSSGQGTTAYLKVAWHAPAATEPDFFPMLVLDAVLTGAKGLNLWSSFRGSPPQRKARLYTRARRARRWRRPCPARSLPTAQPFLYTLSLTAMQGVGARRRSKRRRSTRDRARRGRRRRRDEEVARAKRQLRARLVFENDSVTNIAHQLGYFETVAGPGFFARAAVARSTP